MNTQEAKFILQAYRPNGEDAADPQFTEALALAKLDPELAKWFAEQLAFDATASRALTEVKVPRHLRESILAGKRVIEPALWWKQPGWWAMAAAFVVVLGIAGFWIKSNRDSARFASYQREMIRAAETTVNHAEFLANNAASIQLWLSTNGVETNYVVPIGLRGVAGLGCRVVSWDGIKVSMICFPQQGTNHVDLFIAEKNDFNGSVPGAKPQFAAIGTNTIASWSQAGKVYLLFGHGPADEKLLREYIGPQNVADGLDEKLLVSACLSLNQARGER